MPEVQLTEPLDHAAKKGGFKEVLATVEAAVEADVEALLVSCLSSSMQKSSPFRPRRRH